MPSMPSDLTDSDKALLAEVLRETVAADRYPMSPRVRSLKAILAKIDSNFSEKPAAIPYPPPLPSAQPRLLYRKLRGTGRPR
jgi:hypothetical protein